MKKSIKIILIVTFLASMMIFASILSLTNASTVKHVSLSVRDGEIGTITINLQAKQTVTGAFNVTEIHRDMSIDFWVRDPNGAIILNSGTVVRGENFTFTATNEGEYVLNFDNRHYDYFKTVELEFSVSSPSIIDLPTQILGVDPLVFISIAIAIGAVVAIVGVAVYRTHAKRRTSQIPPSQTAL